MSTSIGSHEDYALVSPQDFTDHMDIHWRLRLQLITSPALRALWCVMAATFRTSIINSINGVVDAPWQILQPPTGSGKTQGACVFAAMQADANAQSPQGGQGALKPVGVLIVTRRIEQVSVITLFDGPSSQLFDGSLVWGFRPRRAQACRRAHGRQGRCAPLTR